MTEPGRYVVAVSGGVDSVVLLHMLKQQPDLELIVAHFDHGIRDDSAEDARFGEELAGSYGLAFETRREELGKQASEELARDRRYAFLRTIADKYKARLVTAHHSDDAIETIAINLSRGTGWRGLAALDSDVARPLLHMGKSEIIDYARTHNLDWHEDSTNASDAYLRNRVRRKTSSLPADEKRQLLGLRAHQLGSKKLIDEEVRKLVGEGPSYSRYFFTHVSDSVAIECLRLMTMARLTRPQLIRSLLAIKTMKPGSVFEAGSSVRFRFTSRNFVIELIK